MKVNFLGWGGGGRRNPYLHIFGGERVIQQQMMMMVSALGLQREESGWAEVIGIAEIGNLDVTLVG